MDSTRPNETTALLLIDSDNKWAFTAIVCSVESFESITWTRRSESAPPMRRFPTFQPPIRTSVISNVSFFWSPNAKDHQGRISRADDRISASGGNCRVGVVFVVVYTKAVTENVLRSCHRIEIGNESLMRMLTNSIDCLKKR
jgi:hypothetical protein